MISLNAALDEKKMQRFSRSFGDTTNQALLRLAISVSKNCAFYTNPRGKGKKKIVDAINKGARLNITALPVKEFNRHAKTNNPAQFVKGRWHKMDQSQILRSEEDVWNFIEKSRDGSKSGRPKWIPSNRKAICKNKDMDAVLKRRRKLAGIAKGSWLGAFKALSIKVVGGDKPRLGKNYMNWAQKHMDMGRGKWQPKRLGKSEADLISNAPSTKDKRIFSNEDAKDAMKSAWRNTIKWYRLQCRLKYEGKGART